MKSWTNLDTVRGNLVAAAVIVLLLAVGGGGWAATASLYGAVIASGIFVVDTHAKAVQHPTGGVVRDIRVDDGDRVRAGDVLIRLDEVQIRANLAVVDKRLDEFAVREARLLAERDGLETPRFSEALRRRAGTDPSVADLIEGEQRLFDLRRQARAGQKAQLRERVAQLGKEIGGMKAQEQAKDREIRLIEQELKGVRDLWRKGLVTMQRIKALERDAAGLDGDRGRLIAEQARAAGEVSETELQIIQIDQDLRSEVASDLRDLQADMAELLESKVAVEDKLRHVTITAPQSGLVHELAVHTVGGVVDAGDVLMRIVPDGEALALEARVTPHDIDQVAAGQDVVLRLSAFNQRRTPELKGVVRRVAADRSTDPETGRDYYSVRVRVPPVEVARLDGLALVPGMPAEAFIRTAERTALSYLMKPMADQMARAFRED